MIVEDDAALSNGIVLALKDGRICFEQSETLADARKQIAKQVFDLIILDINLPDGSGLDFLVEIKRQYHTAVILLTANDMETDIVAGLEMGADDYITKPFSLMVLRARVNTQLRRGSGNSRTFRDGVFCFDFEQMEYSKAGQAVELSKTEQKLLKKLVENRGITLRRSDLIDCIWTDGAEYVDENALSVTIKRLRDKLEDQPSAPMYIRTVYGIGYAWSEGAT